MIQITYGKNRNEISKELNIDIEGEHVAIGVEHIASALKRIKQIGYVVFFSCELNDDYSLLDIEVIEELLLFLTQFYRRFSLVIKQSDKRKKKIVIHYMNRSYSHTEITNGDKTYFSYSRIKQSIEFANNVFSNVIE